MSDGLATLEQVRPSAGDGLADEIDAVLARRTEFEELLVAPLSLPAELVKTRRHGDFRLAQVLVAKGDVMLVDLEGESLRPLDERRAKALPLTDVAGMLRSFDQAAWASVLRFAEADPLAFEQLLTPALAWRDLARAAFLEEYRMAIAGCPSWPGDDAADALLRIILMGSKFREVMRELADRPSWARVPLRGLVDLLRARTSAEPAHTEA